jgi:hypothetical protein
MDETFPEYDSFTKEDLEKILSELESQLVNIKMIVDDENYKYEKYKVNMKFNL